MKSYKGSRNLTVCWENLGSFSRKI